MTIKYKDYFIEENVYGNNEFVIQHNGKDNIFTSYSKACQFIDQTFYGPTAASDMLNSNKCVAERIEELLYATNSYRSETPWVRKVVPYGTVGDPEEARNRFRYQVIDAILTDLKNDHLYNITSYLECFAYHEGYSSIIRSEAKELLDFLGYKREVIEEEIADELYKTSFEKVKHITTEDALFDYVENEINGCRYTYLSSSSLSNIEVKALAYTIRNKFESTLFESREVLVKNIRSILEKRCSTEVLTFYENAFKYFSAKETK